METAATDRQLTLSGKWDWVDTDSAGVHGLVAAQNPEADSRVILQTPVTISLYRCASVQRTQVIDVTVPESENDINVRVTLQASGSSMEWTYVSYVCTVENSRTQKVTIEYPDDRNYICTAYADGVLIQRLDLSENEE